MVRYFFSKGCRFFALLTALTLLMSVSLPAPLLHSETGVLFPQKGMCFVTWDKSRFASEYADKSLLKLTQLGVEYISLVVTQYQEQYNSTDIKKTDLTPSDKSLIHAIKEARKLGLKVMMKPHVDLIDKFDGSYWRADIGFSSDKDWKKWFKEYNKFILHYARLCEKYDVELLCVGTELSFTTQKNDDWLKVIAAVRKVYSGKIIYAANWDNYKNVRFWHALDYVGIDAYFPLTYKPNPSIEDLKKGWEKWRYELESWYSTVNKPIIFTEIGYASTPSAPMTPWKGGTSGNADPEIQAKCYAAFFDTIWDCPWFAGVYWWRWDTSTRAGGKNNRQFTPQNKPAQEIVAANYKNFNRNTTYAMAK